jgi:hypothetical protein
MGKPRTSGAVREPVRPPGSYDPLAGPPAEPSVTAQVVAQRRSLPAAVLPELPRRATDPNGDRDGNPDPSDEGEEDLVVIRG